MAEEQKWQLIETAPKDMRAILAFRNRTNSGVDALICQVTYWSGYEWLSVPGKYAWAPTHWMPLPDPPC